MNLKTVPIEKIKIPTIRARSHMTPEQRQMLQRSISEYGIVDPILLRKAGPDRYVLVAGENRIKEAEKTGKKEIEAIVSDMTTKDAVVLHLIENLARGEVNDMETAEVLSAAINKGASIMEIAKSLNHTKRWVKDRLKLLKLPKTYQDSLRKGELRIGHVKQALKLPNPEEIEQCLTSARNLDWDVVTTKHYTDNRLAQYQIAERSKKEGVRPPAIAEINPQRMSTVEQCHVCGEFVPRKTVTIPHVCGDCREVAEYVISQVGKGKDAMTTIYKAMRTYNSYLKGQEIKRKVKKAVIEEEKASEVVGGR